MTSANGMNDARFYISAAYPNHATLVEQSTWVLLNGIREVLYVGGGSGFVPAYLRAQGVARIGPHPHIFNLQVAAASFKCP